MGPNGILIQQNKFVELPLPCEHYNLFEFRMMFCYLYLQSTWSATNASHHNWCYIERIHLFFVNITLRIFTCIQNNLIGGNSKVAAVNPFKILVVHHLSFVQWVHCHILLPQRQSGVHLTIQTASLWTCGRPGRRVRGKTIGINWSSFDVWTR